MLWQGQEGNIPVDNTMFVVPITIRDQTMHELRRFLQPGSFDLFPYEGTLASRPEFWTTQWKKSMLPEGRKILIATINVRFSLLAIQTKIITGYLCRRGSAVYIQQAEAPLGSRPDDPPAPTQAAEANRLCLNMACRLYR